MKKIRIGVVCMVIVAVSIFAYHYPGEMARSYMLGIIDEALLEDGWVPDYIDSNGTHIYFRNSGTLTSLHHAVRGAKMVKHAGAFLSAPPIIIVGEQEISGINGFAWGYGVKDGFVWEYPAGIWWIAEQGTYGTYTYHFRDYISQIKKDGEGSGLSIFID